MRYNKLLLIDVIKVLTNKEFDDVGFELAHAISNPKCNILALISPLQGILQWLYEHSKMQDKLEKKEIKYQEYLDSVFWELTRNKALEKAGRKCQLCSNKSNLQVHHTTYENLGCEKENDLIVLCDKCHGKFHDKLPGDKKSGKRARSKKKAS